MNLRRYDPPPPEGYRFIWRGEVLREDDLMRYHDGVAPVRRDTVGQAYRSEWVPAYRKLQAPFRGWMRWSLFTALCFAFSLVVCIRHFPPWSDPWMRVAYIIVICCNAYFLGRSLHDARKYKRQSNGE